MGKPVEGSNDGDFSGINPERLKETISALERDQKTLHSRASYYKQQFDRYGIPTTSPNRLLKIAGWADGELPMLRRRHHLALNMEVDFPGFKGMTQINENDVSKSAVTQARKDGRALGEEFKKALKNGDGASEGLFHALDAHSNDADFVNSFYKTLGPDRLAGLAKQMDSNPYGNRYTGHPDQLAHDRNVIAETLSTFSQTGFEGQTEKQKQANWNKWFDDFVIDPLQGFSPDHLLPLLKGGKFDKDFLVALGDRVFNKKANSKEGLLMHGTGKGPWKSDHYTQLFDAIAQNPEASGEWMDHNYDDIQSMIYPHGRWGLDEPKSRASAFVKVAHAATIALSATNEKLAEKLTAHLMFDNYIHTQSDATKSIHPVGGMDYLYSEIVSSHWKDLESGITSPIADKFWMGDAQTKGFAQKASKWDYKDFLAAQDPSTKGIQVGAPLWQALMNESARDPKAAGRMSAIFDTYRNKSDQKVVHLDRSTDDAVKYAAMSRGLMMKAYGQAFDAGQASAKDDAEKWAEGVNAARQALIGTALDAAQAGMKDGPAGLEEMGAGMAVDAGKGLLSSMLYKAVDAKPEEAPGGLADKYKGLGDAKLDLGWQEYYRSLASKQLAKDSTNPQGGFQPYITPPVSVNPKKSEKVSYSGDPKQYIHNPKENFLKSDGTVMDMSDIQKTPQKLAAYGKWLTNYAVIVKVNADGFTNGALWQGPS